MKKLFIILNFLIVPWLSSGQQNGWQLSGTITDSASQEPIANASIKVSGTTIAAQANAKGIFTLLVPAFPIVLNVSHLNYATVNITIESTMSGKVNVKLQKKTTVLPVLAVTTNHPQTLAREQPLYFKDYDFYDDKIIALAYKDRMQSKAMLCLLNMDGDTICTLNIRDAENLYRDCFSNNHLLTKSTAWQIVTDSNYIDFLYPSDIEEFNALLKPVIAEKNDKFFYRHYYYNNQLLQYTYYDKSTRKTEELKVIADENKLYMLRDRARIILGADDPEMQERFENLAFYKPLFAPLVKINDTICIFNYVDSLIEFFSDSCKLVKETQIKFPANSFMKHEIFVDEAKGKVYALFVKNGITTLTEINLKNGELQHSIVIPKFPFIEKIKVYDNNIYFLYTENNAFNNCKRLYKMKI